METIVLTATLSDGSQEFISSIQDLMTSREISFDIIQSIPGVTNIVACKTPNQITQDNINVETLPSEIPPLESSETIVPPDAAVNVLANLIRDMSSSEEDIAQSEVIPAVIVEPNKPLCKLMHLNHDDYIPYSVDEFSDSCRLYVTNVSDVMGYVKFNFKGCEYNYPCKNIDGNIIISCCILFDNDNTIYNCDFIIKSSDNEDECMVVIGKNLVDRISTG